MYPKKLEIINVLGKNITGKEFNELFSYKGLFKRKELLKLTNKDEIHNTLHFKDGLNIVDSYDYRLMNSRHHDDKGIHFTTKRRARKLIYYSDFIGAMRYMRKVTIPDDAQVFIFSKNEFKTDKIILGERQDICQEIYMDYVWNKKDVVFISKEFVTRQMCEIAATRNGYTLHFMPDHFKDMDLCMRAVKGYGGNLEDVPKHLINKELCIEAVKQNGLAINYVPHDILDKEICLTAIRNYPYILKDIPNKLKDRDIYLEAVKTNGNILSDIPQNIIDREMCVYAVNQNGRYPYNHALKYVPKEFLDKELCMMAVENYGYAIHNVPLEMRDKEICIEAAKNTGKTLQEIVMMGYV